MEAAKLILLRHGQSIWNLQNLFTGWVDIPLTEQGIQEAINAGKQIKEIPIDIIYTSKLIRAQMTAMLAMDQHKGGKFPVFIHPEEGEKGSWGKASGSVLQEKGIPVICAWELNERMYGDLQGLNKAETAEKYGKEQVQIWRRSFDIPPPSGESLKKCAERTLPFFDEHIIPHLQKGQNVFISAHGNSLRSIMMELDSLSQEEVVALELKTGEPIMYEYKNNSFRKTILEPK